MRIETIVKRNGLYTVVATETDIDSTGSIVSAVTYSAAQEFNFKKNTFDVKFSTSEFGKVVPERIKRALAEILNYVSKEF